VLLLRGQQAWRLATELACPPRARHLTSQPQQVPAMEVYNELLMSRAFWAHDALPGVDV
jgi:hypothetical protein